MRWLDKCSAQAVTDALRVIAPELADDEISVREKFGEEDPEWWAASAMVGDRCVAKFAWSRPAALRVAHEIDVLEALTDLPSVPYVPEIVASSTDPLLLVTRRIHGTALFDIVDTIDRNHAGRQLATFLAALHDPTTLDRVEHSTGELAPALMQPATTETIREGFVRWIRPDQVAAVMRWCDWTDEVLATPAPQVLVHGDLHGGNQVWNADELQVIVDFETAGTAEPEYDLRAFPGTGPGVELLQYTSTHYRALTGRPLSAERIMAWHLRTTLADALWRCESGVPLPDHRTPSAWVADLSTRFTILGLTPT
ncbi:aminoglycoside phosphotransferase family protein [Kribbella sp. NPDC048915]|uniref:phosphotransferase family protein n=1 Tax=Kribbella sp. NPDC048915 TaxID=3155148 RepID=UPI0033DEA3EE